MSMVPPTPGVGRPTGSPGIPVRNSSKGENSALSEIADSLGKTTFVNGLPGAAKVKLGDETKVDPGDAVRVVLCPGPEVKKPDCAGALVWLVLIRPGSWRDPVPMPEPACEVCPAAMMPKALELWARTLETIQSKATTKTPRALKQEGKRR